VLSVLLLLSGIGLVRMKGWAWWTSVICGAITVVWDIAHSVYQWIYISPATARWYAEKAPKPPAGTPDISGLFNSPIVTAMLTVLGLVFSVGLPVALVIVMLLPNVRAAFADEPRDDSRPKGQ
jgi:hypothetical protein